MPDRGLLEPGAIVTAALVGPHPAPWTLTGARWAQVTFEVEREAAMARIPGDVSRPVPCYARLFLVDAADSPAGPLRMAALMLGGRFRMLPKNVLVDAVVDGPAAAAAGAFGAPFRAGAVTLTRDGARLEAVVADESGELARVTLPALYAVDAAMLRWDAWLGYVDHDGAPGIVEYGPQPEPREAFLSKGATVETPAALPRGHAWRALKSIGTITACYEEGTLTLSEPVFQQVLG
jgi:hypothetical protein